MIPVLWPAECRALDAAANEPVESLVQRAGAAVARSALRLLGGSYGKRVTVVWGPGNNGADGRVAGRLLARRGVRVRYLDALDRESVALVGPRPAGDLLIDAAFGTGFRDDFWATAVHDTAVLAVDIASGVDAATGELRGRVWPASMTVTFACAKPGLLLHPGRAHSGHVEVADIGLGAGAADLASAWWVERSDLRRWPRRPPNAHKWSAAVGVVAGSPGMWGASGLVAAGAAAAGAGMVRLIGHDSDAYAPIEAVRVHAQDHTAILAALAKCRAAVVGPGLGRNDHARTRVDAALEWPGPLVLDADGLAHIGSGNDATARLRRRSSPTVITPHAAEFTRLLGRDIRADVVEDVRDFARSSGSVVLLKGPTTVVCDESGHTWFVTAGDERLATAGTGDVLAGVIAAGLALSAGSAGGRSSGVGEVVAVAAALHGYAATLRPGLLVAGALPSRIGELLGCVWMGGCID